MTAFILSLKRLYKNKKISIDKLTELLEDGEITQEEFDYIIG